MIALERSLRKLIKPVDRRPIWEWAASNIKFPPGSPFPGPFRIENVPWMRRVFEAWQDPKVRRITITGVPQESGKTVGAQVCMLWQGSEDAAPIGFYSATAGLTKIFVDTRLESMIESCPVFKNRIREQQKGTITMKDGTFTILLGAESERSRQSHTLKCIIKDEHYLYDQIWSTQIDDRAKAYAESGDWKIMEMGTGPDEGSPHHINHEKGTREEFEVESPYALGKFFRLSWDQDDGPFRWEYINRDDGTLDLTASSNTIHVICPHTQKRIDWNRHVVKRMVANGRWVATNPDADGSHVSVRIDSFTPAKTPWSDILREWLTVAKGRKIGHTAALREFITRRLAKTWKEEVTTQKRAARKGGYKREEMLRGFQDAWPDEFLRLATMDFQHGMGDDTEHYWFLCRAFDRAGNARLVDCGKVYEASEMNLRLEACGIKKVDTARLQNSRVFIDVAFKHTVVFSDCWRFGWQGIRGEDRDTRNKGGQFPHTLRHKGESITIHRNFSEVKWHQLGIGQSRGNQGLIPWRSINNQGCMDILDEIFREKSVEWTVPDDIDEFCPEYADHISAHAKVNVSKDPLRPFYRWQPVKRDADDHLLDCEKYMVGAALVAEIFKPDSEES